MDGVVWGKHGSVLEHEVTNNFKASKKQTNNSFCHSDFPNVVRTTAGTMLLWGNMAIRPYLWYVYMGGCLPFGSVMGSHSYYIAPPP